jgi:integrase
VTTRRALVGTPVDVELIERYGALGATADARRNRQAVARRFTVEFGGIDRWHGVPVAERLAAPVVLRSYVAWAVVALGHPVDPDYVVGAPTKWAAHVAEREPLSRSEVVAVAEELGFKPLEIRHMWAAMAKLSVISGVPARILADDTFTETRALYMAAVERRCGGIPKIFGTPVFGLNAVMFHLGRGPAPKRRTRPGTRDRDWNELAAKRPELVATMRRYLDQITLSLRPGSVETIDTTLRLFAECVVADHPEVTSAATVSRVHIEAFKPWLAARPGRRGRATLTPTTIGMRLGHLRSFFARIIEWDYDDAPSRVPVFLGDFPIRNRALPRFLDDPAASKLLTAARALPDPFDRLTVEILARTGMRRGELLGLTIDAVVQIGSAFWLRTPVGKLHNDRYIPLHPQLKTLLDDWLGERSPALRTNLMFCDRGRPIPAERVDRAVRRAAAAAGLGHVHPHQLRHTLATQAINRGMSLEAIAALLGHKSLTMTMVYARIADRTVADEYFAVTEKVEALYDQPRQLPAGDEGHEMRKLRAEMHRRMLGNGYCARPVELDCHFESICESCTFFVTTIEFKPTLQRQRDDARSKGQIGREQIFNGLLSRLKDQEAG